jgi:cation transport regulator ChaC
MFKKFFSLIFICITVLFSAASDAAAHDLNAQFSFTIDKEYQKLLLQRVSEKMPCLVTFPALDYPNDGFEYLSDRFFSHKVRIFGYGSLMNKLSASRSVKDDALETMRPAIAYGVKRLFNYKAVNTQRWGENQDPKEKAMLNVVPTLNIASVANGVVIEVDFEDFHRLVQRETGYDLVPVLVTYWDDVRAQNPEVKVLLAYTFAASHELRNHIDYTSTKYYPVRGYLHAVQDATLAYGEEFARMWNLTTYLADGTTSVDEWDESSFIGILCTFEP